MFFFLVRVEGGALVKKINKRQCPLKEMIRMKNDVKTKELSIKWANNEVINSTVDLTSKTNIPGSD